MDKLKSKLVHYAAYWKGKFVSIRLNAIHGLISEVETLLANLRVEESLLQAETDFESLIELEPISVEEDG